MSNKIQKAKKTILITGSTGFIGTNLVKRLLSMGERVIGVDNFYTSLPGREKIFEKNMNYRFVEHDIRYPLNFSERIDDIYNLASPASPQACSRDPLYTLDTNIIGTRNMLDIAKKNHAIFIQASTSEVYGDPLEHPQKETYFGNNTTMGPRSCYDEGKRVAETLCYEYFNQGLDVRVVRIFNTYGPYIDDDGRVIANFILQALHNRPITVYGEGNQTRSFCYIDDLVNGIIRYMELKDKFLGPINIGNPQEITILELTKTILKLIPNSKSKIILKPLAKDDPTKRKPDINLAKLVLNWEPKVNLEDGLKRTISYLIKNTNYLSR